MKNEMSRFAPVSHFTQGYPIFHYMLLSDLFCITKWGQNWYYKVGQFLCITKRGKCYYKVG